MLPDPYVLWKFQPKQTSYSGVGDNDPLPQEPPLRRYTINSHGWRGEELGNGPKVLFLGCSHTFGMGVHDWETSPYLTQKKLGIQCINAAVPGWGMFQCAHIWPELMKKHEIIGIVWQKPSVFRFPERDDCSKSVWFDKEFEFTWLNKSDPLKYRRRLAESVQAEIDWFEEIGLVCRERKIPIYTHYLETLDQLEEVESIRVAVEYGYVKTFRQQLRSILSCQHYTDMVGKYPQTDYWCASSDHHPNLLYNEILSDLIAAHLRRDLWSRRM
jgi:hypothetical protein